MDDLQHELADIERRTRRYWFEDGLAEIFSAAVFLLVGLHFLLQRLLLGRLHPVFLNGLLPVLVVALAFAGRRLVLAAKSRYVYPRTGYVAFRRPVGHRYATGALAFVISALMALLFSRAPLLLNWIPALEGLVFGVAFLSIGKKTGILRYPIEGIAAAILGLAMSLLHLHEDVAAGLLFVGVACVVLAGGIVGFTGYLRRAPRRGDA